MKTRGLIFVLGAALMVSFGVFSNIKESFTKVNATTDLGTISFENANSDSTSICIYGVCNTPNSAPAGWETEKFAPLNEQSGTFLGGNRVGTEIKKLNATTYYVPVPVTGGVSTNDEVTVKGQWGNSSYTFTVEEITFKWNGAGWVIPAAPATDIGTISFSSANSDSTLICIYGINNTPNEMPMGWETEKFVPLNEQSGTFIGNNRVGAEIKKLNTTTYYIPVTGATSDTPVTIKGEWGNSKYTFTVEEITLSWDGYSWYDASQPATDLGNISFDGADNSSTVDCIKAINNTANAASYGANSKEFTPLDIESGVFIGENLVGHEIKKITSNTYSIPVTGVDVDTEVVIKGEWGNGRFTFTVSPLTLKWNGTTWELELEPYDIITLSDTCFDDKDRESFESNGLAPCAWNTYVQSSTNTRNSFAFRFQYEAYEVEDKTLNIKIGGSGAWNVGHHYHLLLDNAWGSPKGAIWFYEENGDAQIYTSGELKYDLQPGTRHTIEFGSIYLVNSDNTLDFVKYDGETIFRKIKTPASHERSTKVGYSYDGSTVFFGSAPIEKENTQILKPNYLTEDKKGIYLDAGLNDIPSGWEVKGAPASKYSALLNGKPMYEFGTAAFPIVKWDSGEEGSYYLSLIEDGGINIALQEGDVITLSGDFHFYHEGKAYSMSVKPVSILYSDNQISEIKIKNHLYKLIQNHCNLDYYDDDKVETINQIVSEAETPIITFTGDMKSLWDLYYDYIDQLDAVPVSEAKMQELLNQTKVQAKATLNALLDSDKYNENEFKEVKGYVEDAIKEIDLASTDTIDKVNNIVDSTLALVDAVETKLQNIEKTILASDTVLNQYLDSYEVVTTTDLNAVGNITFGDKTKSSYHSGDYNDTTTRIATSSGNTAGNMIFQFKYYSDDPTARCVDGHGNEFGAQIFVRLRGTDSNAYRFDIAATPDEEGKKAGVALCLLKGDKAVDRIVANDKLKAKTTYSIKIGAIDLKGYNRTFLFMMINDKFVLKTVVDSLIDARPTVAIRDSYVKSPHYARLSAIETDVTKTNYSTLLGRTILDEESSKNGALALSLKDNDIPVNSILYPIKGGSFKLNDKEVDMVDYRPAGYIKKTGQNKYVVSISGHAFANNDKVFIGGYFSVYSAQNATKSVYRLFDTTLIYHKDADSWEQIAPTDPETIKYEAKETIDNLDNNLTNYSETNANEIRRLVEQYIAKVDKTDAKDIPTLIDEVVAKIMAIKTLLDEYKDAAKATLSNYRSSDLYRADEQAELVKILNDAYAAIDKCNDNAAIDKVVKNAKASIDKLKTASQRDAEELADAKKQAKNEIDAYFQKIEMNRYNDAEVEQLTNMTYDAYDDVDNATSIEEINSVVDSYKEAVKAVQTKDGSTFDGETYIEPPTPKKACGGSIEATAGILSFVALLGAATLIIAKKLKEN